jgi:glycosyltransferase involved in cell wall biosynthesis
MRFCMLTTFFPPWSFGGDGIFVRDLAGALAARGHEVHVIHCRDSYRALAGGPPTQPADDPPGVVVHGLESAAGVLSPLATQQTGRPWLKQRAIEAVLARGFDVIHFHNASLIGGPGVLGLGDAIKLYTLHEYWLVCPTHLLFRFGRAPCETPRCTLCTLHAGRPPQWWRATGALPAAIRHVDAFLSPSRFGITMHRRFGFAGPLVHLPSFVPEASPRAPTAPAAVPEPFFLYAGRLEHAKGPATLVDHFRRFGRARLVLAGAGSEERRLRAAAGNDRRIELRGHVDRDALAALYRQAVAVIVPSLTLEVLPLVVLEAFREGTPVIVRDRGALPEMVADSGGGLVYGDDAALDAAVRRLLADPAERAELGRRARRAWEREWSPGVHLQRYLGLIDEIAARRVPRERAS